MKRSEYNGATWSELRVLYTNSSGTEVGVVGNAAPVQDVSTGRIWIPFCINNEIVFITHSDDDGVTFSDPVFHPELTLSDWKWIGECLECSFQIIFFTLFATQVWDHQEAFSYKPAHTKADC